MGQKELPKKPEMSVFMVIFDQDGYERFVGTFTSIEKANDAVKMCPGSYGNKIIRKIDTDQVYLTKINDCEIKSSTDIGEEVSVTKCNKKNGFKVSEKFRASLHKDNELDEFLRLEEAEESEESEPNEFHDYPLIRVKPVNYPKRPMGPCMFFTKEVRQSVRDNNPDSKGSDVMLKIIRMWQNLGESGQAKYVIQAEEDRKRYERELEQFQTV